MTKNHWHGISAGIALFFGAIIVIWFMSPVGDGFEEGKEYALAYTYLSYIKMPDETTIQGRTFDFADRNLPRTSVVVPLRDSNGLLVLENRSKPGTVTKFRRKVPKRIIDGVTYPAYEYIFWGFSFNLKSEQEFIPLVIPKK